MPRVGLTLDLWLSVFAVGGSVAVPVLVSRGLRSLGLRKVIVPSLRWAAAAAGGAAGCAAALAAVNARSWWLLPAFTAWAVTLTAAALCDAVTQRVPTALVRQGGLSTAVLVIVAAVGDWDYLSVLLTGVACLSVGAIMVLCWRFAGLGFGDVRLGVLGGFGLGHATHHGIVIAIATFTVVTLTQALVVLARGGSRDSKFPYGPALTLGFLLAAAS